MDKALKRTHGTLIGKKALVTGASGGIGKAIIPCLWNILLYVGSFGALLAFISWIVALFVESSAINIAIIATAVTIPSLAFVLYYVDIHDGCGGRFKIVPNTKEEFTYLGWDSFGYRGYGHATQWMEKCDKCGAIKVQDSARKHYQ